MFLLLRCFLRRRRVLHMTFIFLLISSTKDFNEPLQLRTTIYDIDYAVIDQSHDKLFTFQIDVLRKQIFEYQQAKLSDISSSSKSVSFQDVIKTCLVASWANGRTTFMTMTFCRTISCITRSKKKEPRNEKSISSLCKHWPPFLHQVSATIIIDYTCFETLSIILFPSGPQKRKKKKTLFRCLTFFVTLYRFLHILFESS